MPTLEELAASPQEPAIEMLEPEPYLGIPEEDLRWIEASIGLKKPDPLFRGRLLGIVQLYLEWPEPQMDQVRPSQYRKPLKKLLKDARRLRENLYSEEDEPTECPQYWAQAQIVMWLLSPRENRPFMACLHNIIEMVENQLASLPPGPVGRPRDGTLYGVVYSLAGLYFEVARKIPTLTYDASEPREPYGGRFFTFVRTFLAVFSPERDRGNQSLGKTIDRVLQHWRKAAGMDKTSPKKSQL